MLGHSKIRGRASALDLSCCPVGLAPQSSTSGTWGLTSCWEAKSFTRLLSRPLQTISLQVPEGVPHRAVPTLRAAQMHTASALYLLPLALCEPASPPLHPPAGWHLQLQSRCLLHEVRRGYRPLPRGRRVSALPALRGAQVSWVRCPQNKCGTFRKLGRGCFGSLATIYRSNLGSSALTKGTAWGVASIFLYLYYMITKNQPFFH